ncbi:MAG: glycosyltransferase family 4 protein [Actinomycetales bacterium]
MNRVLGHLKRLRNQAENKKKISNKYHVLIIVQNLPVPLDRRVWLECQSLIAAGYEVSVICIKGPDDPDFEVVDGVSIYKYRPAPEAEGLRGFALEFTYSWIRTAVLSIKVWARKPFDVIQACNPPDTYWLLALLWRLRGVKFVFDQHDLNPELFLSRFGEPTSLKERTLLRGLTLLEAATYRVADHVISTNESYRALAMERGGLPANALTVVRSGPDTSRMRPVYPSEPTVRDGFELAYLGIMGPQDGVEILLHVMRDLVHDRGRTDVHATLMGFGDCLERLKKEAVALDVDHFVTFTGRAEGPLIAEVLSRADLGIGPDPKTPLNDVSTMNKTMEYMAFGLPSVAFDLHETRVSGGDAVVYVPAGDLKGYADAIEGLLAEPQRRVDMGRLARERVVSNFDWRGESVKYVSVYHALNGRPVYPATRAYSEPASGSDPQGRIYVNLRDPVEFETFLSTRGLIGPDMAAGSDQNAHDTVPEVTATEHRTLEPEAGTRW